MIHNRKFTATIAALLILAALLGACNAPAATKTDAATVRTHAASTAVARLTEAAAAQPSPTSTETPAPSDTPPPPTATLDAAPTDAASVATATQAPTATPGPASSTAPDAASYVADVDYPDNAPVAPGEVFTKTWRVRNTGTTTWTTSYSLVCIDAGKFTCPESVKMPKEVKSGEMVDIPIVLTAPTVTGTQKAFFRLRNANGQFFKLDGSGDLWVQVLVVDSSTIVKPDIPTPTITLTPDPTATSTP